MEYSSGTSRQSSEAIFVIRSVSTILGNYYFRIALGLTVGAAFLFLSLRGVSWSEVENELEGISSLWVLCAFFLYWLELSLRIIRWRVLLSHLEPPIKISQISIAFLSGYAVNNVLPAKLGEAFRADLLGRLASVSRLTAFGSIILERLFDMLVILGMATCGVLFITTTQYDTLEQVNRGLVVLVIPISILAILVYLLVANKNAFLIVKLKALSTKMENLIHGLHIIEHPSSYLKLIASTFVIWALNCLVMWSILMALNIQLTISQVILLVGITGISAAIPAAPAGIGTLQYAFYLSSVLFEYSPAVAIVASMIVQIALLGSVTLVGALAYSYIASVYFFRPKEVDQ
tara:strand:+ start:567 stop:1607 length:1041 start_codon:yes stop_codon:yes gene_type:complete